MTALAVFWLSGLVLVHPMPDESLMSAHRHCVHPGHWATSHLFCRHGASLRSEANVVHCPHAAR
jgi:hypothetical protein